MPLSFEEFKRMREQAQAEVNSRELPTAPDQTYHRQRVWRDWKGNVNVSDLDTGQTERAYQAYDHIGGANSNKAVGKDSFLADVGQSIGGAFQRQGASLKNTGANLLIGMADLFNGKEEFNPAVGSALWRMEQGAKADFGVADKLAQDSKYGNNKATQLVMDLTSGAVDLASDTLLSLATMNPTAGLAAMGARSYGGAAYEAAQEGKTRGQQFLSGLKSAGIEILTEKIGGPFEKVYGKSLLGKFTNGLVDRLGKNAGMRFALNSISNFSGEAVEEMLSDVLNPLADKLLRLDNGEGWRNLWTADGFSQMAYDGLVGGLLGLAGGAAEGLSGTAKAALISDSIDNALASSQQGKSIGAELERDTDGKAAAAISNHAPQTPVEAQQPSTQQVTPEATETPGMAPSREFNLKPEAETAAPVVQPTIQPATEPVLAANPQAANPQAESAAIDAAAGLAEQEGKEAPKTEEFTEEAKRRLLETEAKIKSLEERLADAHPNYKPGIQIELDGYKRAAENARKRYGIDKDANIEAQPVSASTVAAQPQEGQSDGRTENPGEVAGRQDVRIGGRPEPAGSAEADKAASDRGTPGGVREVHQDGGRESVSGGDGRRVSKARDAVTKRDASKLKAFRAETAKRRAGKSDVLELYNSLQNSGLSETEINERLFDQSVASAVRAALEGREDAGHLMGALLASGFDADTAKEIQAEILDGEEAALPFSYEGGPKEVEHKKSKDTIRVGKIDLSKDEKGRGVATVRKEGNAYSSHLDKDTKTVRFDNEKYKRNANDSVINRNDKTGSYIVKRGAGDNYVIVNSHGFIEGTAYDDIGKARARLYGHSDVYQSARITLGDNRFVRFDKGQLKLVLDTDRAFTAKDILITQSRSQASDDLGVEYSSYLGTAVTTDMFTFDFSNTDNDGVKRSKQDIFAMKKRLNDLIDHGVYGKNGKHYVFAGQTASQSKNNIVVMMEETAYNEFRKNMVAGLDPDTVAMFNPAKYLANMGTYFSPSNADTGVKVRDAIVAADVYNTVHNVTRRFLRTSDMGKDKAALMAAGLTAQQADEKLNQYKVGEAFLITGDLVLKSTDGTGFIMSEKGESFQYRSAGGFKGLLQAFNFVDYFNDVIPYDPKAEYVWTSDDGKTATGGVRFVDKKKGVEILDKWGTWQPINGKKAILFDSTVKFAGEFKSSKEFYEKAGNYDVRSIPKENVYGSNPDSGMVEGYTRRGMAQLLRSQTALSNSDLQKVLDESVRDPINAIMSDTRMQAKLFGVDLDSKKPPASTDLKAMMVWYFGEDLLNSKQGQKWVSQKLGQIVEDARGGKMYFPKDKTGYQWVAPDPFGLVNAMTSLKYQDAERKTLSETALSKVARQKRAANAEELGEGKGTKGLKRGQISAGNLAEGLTLLGRYPSMEENDVQLRTNVRDARYDELVKKYGASADITYFALNDELSLNLDNDYDGDAVLAVQGALAEAIRNTRIRAGIDTTTGAKKGGVPTEFVHGQAEKAFIHDSGVIVDAVRAGLEGEPIGTFDMYIDYIQSMNNRTLKKAADKRNMKVSEFRAMLLADFAAAYKFNVDYAKTGYYPQEFKAVIDNYKAELIEIAADNGYYVGEGNNKMMPIPAAWEYSNKQSKRDAFAKALAKQRELAKKGSKKKTILYGNSGQNLLYQMYWANDGAAIPDKKVSDFYEFYKDRIEKLHSASSFDLSDVSTIDPLAYTNLDAGFVETLNETYRSIMKSQGDGSKSNEHREKLLHKMFDALELDNEQFTSLMSYVLSIDPQRANWNTFINFDQKNGELPTSHILARNMRILGNLATISDAMGKTQKSIDEQAAAIKKAKQDIRDAAIDKYAANEIAIQEEASALISELESVTSQIQDRIAAAEKTKSNYEGKAYGAKTLEAYMKAADGFERYSEKVDALKGKLATVQSELNDTIAVKQESKELLGRIVSAVNQILSDESIALTSMTDRLAELQSDYDRWLRNFETEKTKQEFYGIGVDGETGLEDADFDELTDKMNGIIAEASRTFASVKAEEAEAKAEEPPRAEEKVPQPEEPVPSVTAPAEPTPASEPQKQTRKEPAPEPVKKAEETTEKNEPVERTVTYGDSYDNIERAAKRISAGIGEGAKTIIPDSAQSILKERFGEARRDIDDFGREFMSAISAEDDGYAIRSLAEKFPEKIKGSVTLRTLLGDAEKGNAAKAAKRLAEAKDELSFREAAESLSEIVAKEVEELPKTIETINTWMENNKLKGKLAKFLSSDNVVAKGLSMFFGYQRDFVNIAMALDNFDKAANGPGYRLANRTLDSLYNANDLYGNAMYESSEARRAFDASPASKKTVKLEFVKNKEKETHTLSMAEAIDLLHNIVTLEESKINAWENINYFFDDGSSMKIPESGWFSDVKLQLQNAIKKDSDAKAFYDTLSELYEMYAEPSQTAIANASGRTVDMFSEGRYYPLWRVGNIKAAAEAKDFNIGIDDALYTKSRIKTDGGNIRITDPTKRFDSYMSMANKVVMNAEIGAALERLDRGGLVPSLTEVVEDRLGKGHTDIVKATIKNANDFRSDNDEASSLLRSLRLNLQTGALFGNFGSMLKQYPSVLNAVGILDFDDILYGARVLFDKSLDAKTSKVGAIRSRFQSNYDPDVHDAFDGDTAFNKFWGKAAEKAPWLKVFSDGFQRVDSKAIKTIYLGACHNVLKNGTAESDPDFEKKVMNLFKPAFLLTQPQYAKLIRPYVQVSENEFVRMFGMFKTQPLRNFNTMIRVVNEYATAKSKYGEGSKELKDASKQLQGTISGQATASLMFGLLGVVSKLLYHRRKDLEDEDGKLDAGKVMARALMNAAEASGGMMVFGDAAVQFLIDRLSGGKTKEYWGLSAGALSTIIDVSDAITDFAEKPSLYGAKKAAGYISQLLGVPLSNAYSILNSGIMYVKDWTDGNEGNYDDILKYLDAQAKAAKKEEEKAAKAAAKEAEKSGADMLADTAKKNASQSELNSKEEQKTTEVSGYLKKPYQALLDSGMSSEKSQDLLAFIDTDDNNSIKQAEMFAFYKDNPDYEQYVMAMWNSYGYKTSWEAYKAKHK